MQVNGARNNLLAAYYRSYFPHEEVCRLLAREWHGHSSLEKRELCIENTDGVYIRWMSVCEANSLRKLFADKRVEKFHTGAIFNNPPYFKKRGLTMEAMKREFVVDIDLNDYTTWGVNPDDIESCDRTWPIVAFGMIVVKHVLKHHFGFQNALVVYSGRRGAHMSVYDERACCLTDKAREAIVSYLQPSDTHGKSRRPPYARILQSAGFDKLFDSHILPFWTNFCLMSRENGGMGALDGPFDKEEFLELFADPYATQLSVCTLSGTDMWQALVQFANTSSYPRRTWLALKETVMCYVWPRLDADVSKHRNHLSKSVFSIHPKTKRICVPIAGDNFGFKPAKCPTYTDLVAGNAEAVSSFSIATTVLSKFIKHIESSNTERWVEPRLTGPFSTVYSMVSRKRERETAVDDRQDRLSNQYCFADRSRFAADTVRVFCALSSYYDPTNVQIFFYTTINKGCVNQVLCGYAPPFRKASTFGGSVTKMFVDAVGKASRNPGCEVVCCKAYTCVLFHPRHTSKHLCESRMQRMADHLQNASVLCTVNATWDEYSIATMVNDMVSDTWNTKYIHLS